MSFPARSECPGIHWSDTEIEAEEKKHKEDQIECRELGKRKDGDVERVVKADKESEKRRTEVKEQEER